MRSRPTFIWIEVQRFRWDLRELPVVSPFSFAIYASKIKESMMLEDPAAARRANLRRHVCARRAGHGGENQRRAQAINDNSSRTTSRLMPRITQNFARHYPEALFAYLASIAPSREAGVGLRDRKRPSGRGSGGAFRRVIATDASAAQIESAQKHDRVEYRVAPAERSGS